VRTSWCARFVSGRLAHERMILAYINETYLFGEKDDYTDI